jgi:Uma2 family endonuclease
VQEYWIVDWRQRLVDIYRREDEDLVHTRRMREPEALESPLLAGFSVPLAQIFRGLPAARLDFESAED